MKAIKKIDIHAHANPFHQTSPLYGSGPYIASVEDLFSAYDQLNIEKGVLMPLVSPEFHRDQTTNGICKYLADLYPDRFLWFCNVDPRSMGNTPNADLSELLSFYKSIGAKGVGELTANLYADDPFVDNLFYHCAACDLPVTIHIGPQIGGCYGIVDDLGLPRIEKMLKKHPNLKLLGHSQPFWAELGTNVTEENRNRWPTGKVEEGRVAKLMREYPNLYCDLSAGSGCNAMTRDPEYTAKFVEEFSDRILYGCDICQPATEKHLEKLDSFLDQMVEDGMISMENYYKIVRGNAIRLLKLDDMD